MLKSNKGSLAWQLQGTVGCIQNICGLSGGLWLPKLPQPALQLFQALPVPGHLRLEGPLAQGITSPPLLSDTGILLKELNSAYSGLGFSAKMGLWPIPVFRRQRYPDCGGCACSFFSNYRRLPRCLAGEDPFSTTPGSFLVLITK